VTLQAFENMRISAYTGALMRWSHHVAEFDFDERRSGFGEAQRCSTERRTGQKDKGTEKCLAAGQAEVADAEIDSLPRWRFGLVSSARFGPALELFGSFAWRQIKPSLIRAAKVPKNLEFLAKTWGKRRGLQ